MAVWVCTTLWTNIRFSSRRRAWQCRSGPSCELISDFNQGIYFFSDREKKPQILEVKKKELRKQKEKMLADHLPSARPHSGLLLWNMSFTAPKCSDPKTVLILTHICRMLSFSSHYLTIMRHSTDIWVCPLPHIDIDSQSLWCGFEGRSSTHAPGKSPWCPLVISEVCGKRSLRPCKCVSWQARAGKSMKMIA